MGEEFEIPWRREGKRRETIEEAVPKNGLYAKS